MSLNVVVVFVLFLGWNAFSKMKVLRSHTDAAIVSEAIDRDQRAVESEDLLDATQPVVIRKNKAKQNARRKARRQAKKRRGKKSVRKAKRIRRDPRRKSRSLSRLLRKLDERNLLSRNHLGIELGGKGLTYSVQYERVVGSRGYLGLGFGHQSMAVSPVVGEARISMTTVPISASYSFQKRKHRWLIGGGVTLVHLQAGYQADVPEDLVQSANEEIDKQLNNVLPDDVNFGGEVTIPLGFGSTGFEYRSEGGFLFRANAYLFAYPVVVPFLGFMFGGHF